MILRKPYAFLIKHFRLIHLIITALLIWLLMINRGIYRYLNLVIKDSVNRYDVLSYINYGVYILIFLAILLCAAIYYLFKYKDKPRRIYIFTIVGYVIIAIFTVVLFTYMRGFLSSVVEQKSIRFYRDTLLVTLLFQVYIVIVMFIRGLGFDIKKFDFNKDAQELNLNESDSEEIEVNTKIDTTNIMRSVRKTGRELSYFFSEFKIYILVILGIVLIILGYRGYNYFNVKYRVYGENVVVGSTYNLKVNNSYYVEDNNKYYVIVDFAISKYGKPDKFNIGNLKLKIDNKEYTARKNICYKYSKYGTCYKSQYIRNESSNYILVFEVDKAKKNTAHLIYNEYYGENYKIKLILKK